MLAIPLIILSNFFFGVGENLIAAFLPELAKGEAMGKVSGWGWSIGFIGGLLSLGASLAYVTWAEGQGQVCGPVRACHHADHGRTVCAWPRCPLF